MHTIRDADRFPFALRAQLMQRVVLQKNAT